MPTQELRIEVVRHTDLAPEALAEILALAQRAYDRNLTSYYYHLPAPTHVIAYLEGAIVSHALWVTRWLQVSDGPLLRTAYVELVATEPSYQRRGFAAAVMRKLVDAVQDFDLAGLCPSDRGVQLYERLGWQFWRGPLSIRTAYGLLPTPGEQMMFLSLPATPHLAPTLPISAEWRPDDLW
jgi:aminoglycoside 2'-N-acetyltransferase I